MKRSTIGLLLLLAMAGMAAASGSQQAAAPASDYGFRPTGMPIVSSPITLEVLYPRNPMHGDFDQFWFQPWLLDRTGIDLEFNLVELAGFPERKALAFASGDLPDVFMTGITKEDENAYGPQGLLVDLAPYIQRYAPLAMEIYQRYPEVVRTMKFSDGAIYVMPSINDSPRDHVTRPLYINTVWLDRLGLSKPTTLDELYVALKAIKEGDPNGNGLADEIPVSTRHVNQFKTNILEAFGFVNHLHDQVDGSYVYVPAQPLYREYLVYMNRLYREGLLDNEYYSQSTAQLQAKRASRVIGVLDANPADVIADFDHFMEYDFLPTLTSEFNSVPQAMRISAFNRSWGIFAMTSANRYPEAAVRLIDYFYSTEGSRAARVGPEYGTWDGNGGYEILTETDTNVTAKLHMGEFTSFWNWRHVHAGPTHLPFMSNDLVNDIIVGSDPRSIQLRKWIFDSGRLDITRAGYPEVNFTVAEQQRIVAFLDLDSYVENMTARFITGEVPINDSQWNAYIVELNRLGLAEMSQIRQAAMERFNTTSTTIP